MDKITIDPATGQVLIIDDDPMTLTLLSHRLQKDGFTVVSVNSGQMGVERATQHPPDVILLDIMMPGVDGMEACRQLKANPVTQAVPIIFMTALGSVEDKVNGFAAGAVDYVTKPFQYAEVCARVRTQVLVNRLQRRLGERNNQLVAEIAEREKVIDELNAFAHSVAHDVSSPVASLQMTLEMLVQEGGNRLQAEDLELLKMCHRNAQRATAIIRELLLLASLRQDEVRLEPLDMGPIVTRAIERLDHDLEALKPEIVLPEQWPPALGRAGWVEEIWYNLLSNACKYGGRPPHIVVGAEPGDAERTRFWVQDNGTGLSESERVGLFAPFVRIERLRARGTGVGLSVVQRIVDRLHGRVGVEGEEGQGARFFFELRRG
jgi:two-component system, sensor histidine kinase and response regulator